MARWIRTVLQGLRKSGDAPPAQSPAAPPPGVGLYYPEVFEADTLRATKAIAIMPEDGMSTDERWDSETDFMLRHIGSRPAIGERNTVLDFGCGVGRMSRALIQRFGCSVVGVDQSAKMREHAAAYVDSPRFKVVSTAEFEAMTAGGFMVDFGFACWVLQHCVYPGNEINRIANALAAEAPFLLVNSVHRLIPTHLGWGQDGLDLDALMGERFTELERLRFPDEVSCESLRDNSAISWWQRRV